MSFTENGYETRRFTDILETVRFDLETRLGTPISSNPDTVIAIINSIISNQVSVLENNIQTLSDNLDIYKADGVYLDRLVNYINLRRLAAAPAEGLLKVTRNSDTTVNSSSIFANSIGTQFIVPVMETPLTACTNVIFTPLAVTDGVTFSLTINSANISITAGALDDTSTILAHFVSEITSLLGLTVVNDNGTLKIDTPDSEINTLNITSVTGFNLTHISAYVNAESVEKKFLQVSPNTITSIVNAVGGVTSVNNPLDFINGRDLETDEELRARYELSFAKGGNTTLDNIYAELLQLPNVTNAFIIENDQITTDGVTGLPPKSYSCVVVDGDPDRIAQAIWDSKPAGIETYGAITTTVKDLKGNTQEVNWSRPTTLYVWVEVSYSLYDEESFPSNGEALIKQAVLDYGNTLSLNNDVIPERFIGDIYRAVDGVDSISIRVGTSTDINDVTPSSGYQSTRLPIGITDLPVFTTAKIEVIAL